MNKIKIISGTKGSFQVNTYNGNYTPKQKQQLKEKYGENIVIIDKKFSEWPIHIGDARKTSALYRKYIKSNKNI